MSNSVKLASSNAEIVNAVANNAASVELFNGAVKESPAALPTTVKAVIDGVEIEIIPAFTNYSMELPKRKAVIKDCVDKTKRLSVTFHLAKPEIFWQEGVILYDRNGNELESITPNHNIYVICDTADTYWRVFEDDVLTNVEVHEFSSVQEFAQTISNTMLYSRALNNVEKLGYASLATGDEALKTVHEFAKSNNVKMSIAELYLDYKTSPSIIQVMMLGKSPNVTPTLGRTTEVAQELFDQMCKTFTKGSAKTRYAIKAVNALLKSREYTYNEMTTCLQQIPADTVARAELMNCGEKELCIASVLTAWLITNKRNTGEVTLQKIVPQPNKAETAA